MAYLSNNDEEDQQNAAKGQSGFNIFAPASSAAQPQSAVGGSSQSGNNQSNTAANSQHYSQTFSGTGSDQQQAPANLHEPASSVMGFGSSTPGGGFINFSSYANANPSQSGNISKAGNKTADTETANYRKIASINPDSGFSSPLLVVGGNTTEGIENLFGNVVTPGVDGTTPQENEETIKTLFGRPKGADTVKGFYNEKYTAPSDYDYTPFQDPGVQEDASELSQTPLLGGANTPSVIDFLARPDIAAGNYGLGERNLDTALIAGDPLAQKAISGNAKKFGTIYDTEHQGILDLKDRVAKDTLLAPAIQAATRAGVDAFGNTITKPAEAAADKFNSDEEARKLAYAQSYKRWYDAGGWKTGSWDPNVTVGSVATASDEISPEEMATLNTIAGIEGTNRPYPDASQHDLTPGSYSSTVDPFDMSATVDSSIIGTSPTQGTPYYGEYASDANHWSGGAGVESSVAQAIVKGSGQDEINNILGEAPIGWVASQYQAMIDHPQMFDPRITAAFEEYLKSHAQNPTDVINNLGLSPEDLKALGL